MTGTGMNWTRALIAVAAATLLAPLASPAFLAWIVVVADGSAAAPDFFRGILAGALFGLRVGFLFSLAGAVALTAILAGAYAYWAGQPWFRWVLLALAVDIVACAGVMVFFAEARGFAEYLFLILFTLPSALVSTFVIRWIAVPKAHRTV